MNRDKGEKLERCNSTVCKLNDLSFTSNLKRIKAHCISCVPERTLKAVRECTVKLFNGKTCPLHFYREGKNPKRQGKGNLKIYEVGHRTRFVKKTAKKGAF
jgi:hypothetical protein